MFSGDTYTLRVSGECMEGFIHQMEREDWKYGDFVSGYAVRMNAAHILDRVKKTVSGFLSTEFDFNPLTHLHFSNFVMSDLRKWKLVHSYKRAPSQMSKHLVL